MNLILNRNFELPDDGWYQLAPLGEFPHSASGTVQVIDAEACARMVSAFEAARKISDNFAGLLIDFDHFSLDAEKKSEAAGWIIGLKFIAPAEAVPRPGTDHPEPVTGGSPPGLYASIRWSDTGEAAVIGGRYRFLSPVWEKADCEELGDNRLRPVRLLNAAVTNDPNLKGILPLSNRTKGAPFDSVLSDRDLDVTRENWMKNLINALLKKLNLPADSTEDVIESAIENMASPEEVDALLNRAETAESELETLSKEKLEADAEAFLEENADLIENREEVRAQFIENRELTEAVFRNLKAPEPESRTPHHASPKPLHNRDSKIRSTRNRDTTASESTAVKIRNRAAEIMKTERIAYTEAFRRAEQELAD